MCRMFRPMAILPAFLVLGSPRLQAADKPFVGGSPTVVTAPSGSCGGVFDDVDNGDLFCPFIEQSYADAILAACDTSPLRFCPYDSVTREQLAKAAVSTLALAQTQAGSWGISGNAGTTPGANFVGTTDDTAFEIHVNGERALRIAPRTDTTVHNYGSVPDLIGGWSGNFIIAGPSPTSPVVGAVIAGGGYDGFENHAHDDFDFIGGGKNNRAGSPDNDPSDGFNTVGGGSDNVAAGRGAFVGGGFVNIASAEASVAVGGNVNTASEVAATVVGGYANVASGTGSTVAGGYFNTASKFVSFAAGYRAKANGDFSFVWADGTESDFIASADNVFKVRATGGVKFVVGVDGAAQPDWTCSVNDGDAGWSCTSDRNLKENLVEADGEAILERLSSLPIYHWSAKDQKTPVPHLGPMAQDFAAAFHLGSSDVLINSMDLDGVALAAIQGLDRKVAEQREEIAELKAQLQSLQKTLASIAVNTPQ